MDLNQLRCFVSVADELHFGRAAQKLGLLPASLSRHIRLLEESLGTRLMARTTRSVSLTEDGLVLLEGAREILAKTEALQQRFHTSRQARADVLRIGAIDSAAAGLIPMLLHDFRQQCPDVSTQLLEDKTIRLIPKLLSGSLDLAFIRAPDIVDPKLKTMFLFHETAVVAMSESHRLASRASVRIEDLADEPLIVNLVAAQIGLAIVPQWTSRLAVSGVRYIALDMEGRAAMNKLPLSVAWLKGVRDPGRDRILTMLQDKLAHYAELA